MPDMSSRLCKYVNRKLVSPRNMGYPERIDAYGYEYVELEQPPFLPIPIDVTPADNNLPQPPPAAAESATDAVVRDGARFVSSVLLNWVVAICSTILFTALAPFTFSRNLFDMGIWGRIWGKAEPDIIYAEEDFYDYYEDERVYLVRK